MFSTVPIVCFFLFLVPCYLSQSVTINISPDTIYVESTATITCLASASSDTLTGLVPFYVINGTYVQHSCIGKSEFQSLTHNLSTLPYSPTGDSTLSARISLSPVSESDEGLSIGCVFYNLANESTISSNVITLSVFPTTEAPNISAVNTTTAITNTEVPLVNSQTFQIAVGSVGGIVALLVVIAILLLLIMFVVCAVKRSKRRKPDTSEGTITMNLASHVTPVAVAAPTPKEVTDSVKAHNEEDFASRYSAQPTNKATVTAASPKEDPDELVKSRTNSIKINNEKEFVSRYTALPTYSVAVNMGDDELSASTDPNAPHQFTSIDVDKEKL